MRSLKDLPIPNIDTSDLANFPQGRFKNKDSTPGTETSERTLGDVIQFCYEVLRRAGIEPNDLPEQRSISQVADAVGFLKPVAIIRTGVIDTGTGEIGIMGAMYEEGYNASFEYLDWSSTGKEAYFKLRVGFEDSETIDCVVQASLAHGVGALVGTTDTAAVSVTATHDIYVPNPGEFKFSNNVDNNIVVSAGNVTDASEAELKTKNLLFIVYKVV